MHFGPDSRQRIVWTWRAYYSCLPTVSCSQRISCGVFPSKVRTLVRYRPAIGFIRNWCPLSKSASYVRNSIPTNGLTTLRSELKAMPSRKKSELHYTNLFSLLTATSHPEPRRDYGDLRFSEIIRSTGPSPTRLRLPTLVGHGRLKLPFICLIVSLPGT